MNAHINKHMLYTKNGYEWNVCVCASNLFKAQNQALDIPLECLKPWGLERAIRHEHQILGYPYKEPQLWFVHEISQSTQWNLYNLPLWLFRDKTTTHIDPVGKNTGQRSGSETKIEI